MSYTDLLIAVYQPYFTSSKLNDIDNQILYYTMVQIW